MSLKLFLSIKNLFFLQSLLFIFSTINISAQIIIPPLPSGPTGPGKFGAYYTKLKYYPEWDNYWRMGIYADVVVRFDNGAEKFIFWRGTNYIPHWISENNIWYNNEFTETWETIGSSEPMSDKQCRYSQVRIIESNNARVIIMWRYALNDVKFRIAWQDSVSGWGDWCDEIYTIYPDGIGTREVILYTSHFGDNSERATDDFGHEWQEGIVLYSANEKPEDDVNIDAVHVANLKGDTASWSWEIPGKPEVDIPEGSNIVLMNLKSYLKPFIISPPGCKLDAYEGSQNGSHFRWRYLKGKIAIVTGGARDMGGQISRKLAKAGASVCLNYFKSAEEAKVTLDEIKADGSKAIAMQGNMTNQDNINFLINECRRTFGNRIDILVNVTGGLIARKSFEEIDEEFFDKVLTLNLKSTFLVTKSILPFMTYGGSIINLSSQAARDGGGAGSIAYSTSKGAILTFTRSLAKELGVKNIRVNAVSPGMVNTSFHDTFTKPEIRKKVAERTALKREGEAYEIADLVVYLASDESSFITGASIEINGGNYFI